MATITTGSFAKLLWPGINKVYGDSYKEHPVEWNKIFTMEKSTKHHEEDLLFSGFGLMVLKPEGTAVSYDSARQGFTTRYTHDEYGLGFVITRNMYEDDQYGVIGSKKARALGKSVRQTKETLAANVLNRAQNASYTGSDGIVLASTAHLNVSGGTFQNTLTNQADLSEAVLEQAAIDIGNWTDDRGLALSARIKRLIVPVENMFNACRIYKTPKATGGADNDVNATYEMGTMGEGYFVNHYLTDTDSWHLITDVTDGLKFFERRAEEFTTDNDFGTENAMFKATWRGVFGWSDPKGVYSVNGV